MLRFRNSISTAATICIAAALCSSPGLAHEPEWERESHDDPAGQQRDHRDDGQPERPRPPVPGDERYSGWEDPYAHERRWTRQIGLGAGYFEPFQGDGGVQTQLEFLMSSPSGHFRIGGEFLYRKFETRLFNVNGAGVDAYHFNLVMHYVATPGGFTPYIGGGLGLHLNDLNRRDIELGNPSLILVDDIGLGYGLFAVLGLELPLYERVSLFAEGRLTLALQATGIDEDFGLGYANYYEHGVDRTEVEDLSGASGAAGIRFRF